MFGYPQFVVDSLLVMLTVDGNRCESGLPRGEPSSIPNRVTQQLGLIVLHWICSWRLMVRLSNRKPPRSFTNKPVTKTFGDGHGQTRLPVNPLLQSKPEEEERYTERVRERANAGTAPEWRNAPAHPSGEGYSSERRREKRVYSRQRAVFVNGKVFQSYRRVDLYPERSPPCSHDWEAEEVVGNR